MTQRRAPGFITSLNALRFFAAIAIVIFHFGRWSWPFNLPFLQSYAMLSNTGVTFFFVLSGFIMVHVYGQKLRSPSAASVTAFYRARIARIVPLYLVALFFVLGAMLVANEVISIKSLVLQVLFLQSWLPHEALQLNFAGWTLSVEMMFYLLFPMLYVAFRRMGWAQAWWLTALVWLIGNAITIYFAISYASEPQLADVFVKFFPPLHLNSFLIGMLAGIWYRESKQISSWLACAALACLFAYPLFVPANLNAASHNGLFAPLFAILIIAVAQSKSFFTQLLSIKPLVIGGDISYGVYILQAPVYAWVYLAYSNLGVREALGEEGRFFLYLVLLCVASWISSVTVERWGKAMIRGTKE